MQMRKRSVEGVFTSLSLEAVTPDGRIEVTPKPGDSTVSLELVGEHGTFSIDLRAEKAEELAEELRSAKRKAER